MEIGGRICGKLLGFWWGGGCWLNLLNWVGGELEGGGLLKLFCGCGGFSGVKDFGVGGFWDCGGGGGVLKEFGGLKGGVWEIGGMEGCFWGNILGFGFGGGGFLNLVCWVGGVFGWGCIKGGFFCKIGVWEKVIDCGGRFIFGRVCWGFGGKLGFCIFGGICEDGGLLGWICWGGGLVGVCCGFVWNCGGLGGCCCCLGEGGWRDCWGGGFGVICGCWGVGFFVWGVWVFVGIDGNIFWLFVGDWFIDEELFCFENLDLFLGFFDDLLLFFLEGLYILVFGLVRVCIVWGFFLRFLIFIGLLLDLLFFLVFFLFLFELEFDFLVVVAVVI